MEIIKFVTGKTEDIDVCFAEGQFICGDEQLFVFAIVCGEMTLLVRSEVSLSDLHNNMLDEDNDEFNLCNYNLSSWNAQDKTICNEHVELDLESVLEYCMGSELETYQCWQNDGNEGLYEASESDAGLAFVIVHDLLTFGNFPNVREMLDDDDESVALISLLEDIEL